MTWICPVRYDQKEADLAGRGTLCFDIVPLSFSLQYEYDGWSSSSYFGPGDNLEDGNHSCCDGGSKRWGAWLPCDIGATISVLDCLYPDCLYLGGKYSSVLLSVSCTQLIYPVSTSFYCIDHTYSEENNYAITILLPNSSSGISVPWGCRLVCSHTIRFWYIVPAQ